MSGLFTSAIGAIGRVTSQLASWADNPAFDFQGWYLAFSWASTFFELYLDRRQMRMYSLRSPPSELAGHLDDATFIKAQAYGKDKLRFSVAKTVWGQLVNFGFLRLRAMPLCWEWSGRIMDTLGMARSSVISQSLIYVGIFSLLSSALQLPWDYYYTFVIEQRHGFNKSTRRLWVTDTLKTYGLLAVIGGPVLAAFLKIVDWAGKAFVPYLMVFIVSVQLVMQIVYPLFIQPLFNKLTPLPDGEFRTRVEALANQLKFPLKHLYQIDGSKRSSHSNAYFYGTPWSKHIVIFDTLMEQSSPAEVEAVLAHELGHWYFNHPLKLLVTVQGNLLFNFTLFAVFLHNRQLFRSFGFDPRLATHSPFGGPQPVLLSFSLFSMITEPIGHVISFLLHALTRRYEYQADEFGVDLDKTEDLKSSLIKLHKENLSSPQSDWLYSMYHHSHPTLPERLRAMDVCEKRKTVKGATQGKKEL